MKLPNITHTLFQITVPSHIFCNLGKLLFYCFNHCWSWWFSQFWHSFFVGAWVGFVPFFPLWSVSSLFSDCPQVSKMQWMGMRYCSLVDLPCIIYKYCKRRLYPKSFKTPQLWTFLHYLYSTVSRFSRSHFRSCILSKYSKLWSLLFSCTQIHVLNLTANPITTILARDWPTYVRESS